MQLENDEVDVIVALTEGLVLKILGGSDMRLLGTYVGSPLCWAISAAGQSSVRFCLPTSARLRLSSTSSQPQGGLKASLTWKVESLV